jgi:hypothetical protein
MVQWPQESHVFTSKRKVEAETTAGIIRGLFNDAVSTEAPIASSGRMMNSELERMWKEARPSAWKHWVTVKVKVVHVTN